MEFSVPSLYMKICFSILVTVYLVDILGLKVAAIELIPETFQTTIQVNLLDERSSVLLGYYYDGKKNRQSVRIMEGQKEDALLINNTNKAVYYLSRSKMNCEVSNLNLGKLELWQYILFGEHPLLTMISDSSKSLTFNHEDGIGKFVTNGTVKNRKYTATFDVIAEIRDGNWSTVTGWKKVPVSVIVKGKTSVHHQPTSFQYQYYFSNFTGNIKDTSVFEIPEGMICESLHSVEEFPDIGKSFHVKIEKIQPLSNKLLEEEWWFQSDMMVARHDHTQWESVTYVHEVHDYVIGVQYTIYSATGHCDIKPLAPWRDDVITDVEASDKNGIRYLKMNSPNELFQMNGIYFKKGLAMVRGIPCEVYITSRRMKMEQTIVNITLEYYISSSWQTQKKPIPIKLLITTENGPAEIYNFVSYEDDVHDFSVFDVTPCYSESAQLHFQISIPGKYDPETRFPLMNRARQNLKEAARVSFLRIQGVTLDYDADFLYLSAILLGTNKPIELFTKLPYGCDEPPETHIVAVNASSIEMCAQLCIDRSHNVSDDGLYCNSFYFHIFQPEGTVNLCRLSNLQKVNDSKIGSEEWMCFYRSVRGEDKFDISSMQAWKNIKANVSKGGFNITFVKQGASQFTSSAEINFGFLYENEEPEPPQSFYMKTELIVNEDTEAPVVQDKKVWYDYQRKLLRIHSQFPSSTDNLSSAVLDQIYDFNSGFMYITGSECKSRQIEGRDTEAIFYNETHRDASIMKDPKSMLHMNGKAIFSGQKNVRGILSDVFLYHSPFYTPMNHINYTKVLQRVFFKTKRPSSGPEKSVDGGRIPVSIEIRGLDSHFARKENIFDFLTLAPDLKNFDISQCFPPEKIAELCVNMFAKEDIPKGYESMFLDSFQNSLAKLTQESPLRFQNIKLVSKRNKTMIIRFFVLPLTEAQGVKGMVPQNKLLQLIEMETQRANLSLSFRYGAKKVYRAVFSGINRQYPICSNIQPKTKTTEQTTVPSCPTLPTTAILNPCPTFAKAATTSTKSPPTSTSKKTYSTPTPTTASTPSTKPSTTISLTTEKKILTSFITKSVKTIETSSGFSVSKSAQTRCGGEFLSRGLTNVGYHEYVFTDEESEGKMIGLSFGMLFIGMILGAILHRSLSRNGRPGGREWFALRLKE